MDLYCKRIVNNANYFLLSTLFFTLSFAQAPDILWTRRYGRSGSKGHSVQQTSNGGYILAGETKTASYDVYIIKTDQFGDTLWTKTYGGNSYDRALSVQETFDEGFILVGESNSFSSGTDVYLIKTNANGDTLWIKFFGGIGFDEGYSVQQTLDGGYIIAGCTRSFGTGSYDVWLLKTDAGGDTVWTRTYGNVECDIGFSVQQTADSGYIVAGYTFSNGSGNSDAFLLKTDPNGNTHWRKLYGRQHSDCFHSVQQTPDSGYVAAGWTLGGSDYYSAVYLVKTDSLGDTLWTRTYTKTPYNEGYSVDHTSDGGYIVAGNTIGGRSDIYLIRTNSNGDTLWTKTILLSVCGRGNSVQQTFDDGYIVVGTSSDRRVYLIRLASEIGIEEDEGFPVINNGLGATIFNGPLVLPEGKKYKVFDITGRVVEPDKIQPGIYFLEVDGKITRKVIKIR